MGHHRHRRAATCGLCYTSHLIHMPCAPTASHYHSSIAPFCNGSLSTFPQDTNKYPPTPPSPHPVQPPPPSNPTNSDEDGWACDEDEGGGEAGKQLQPWARPTAIQAAASKRTAPSSFNKLPTCPPIEAGCVGAPFFRFIRPDASRLEAARQGKQGAAVYEVKQPEWREMSFAGGLPELLGAMQAWPSRRLMTQLPLGACIPMTQRQGGTSFQASSCWRVCLDASAATQLGVGGVGGAVRGEEVARALMQPVALWCAQWLGQGGGGQGRGNHADDGTATPDDHGKNDDDCVSSVNNHTHSSVGSQDGCRNSGCGAGGVDSGVSGITADVLRLLGPPGVWSQADVALRVWSHGACEPLRCDMSDQLVVQVGWRSVSCAQVPCMHAVFAVKAPPFVVLYCGVVAVL